VEPVTSTGCERTLSIVFSFAFVESSCRFFSNPEQPDEIGNSSILLLLWGSGRGAFMREIQGGSVFGLHLAQFGGENDAISKFCYQIRQNAIQNLSTQNLVRVGLLTAVFCHFKEVIIIETLAGELPGLRQSAVTHGLLRSKNA